MGVANKCIAVDYSSNHYHHPHLEETPSPFSVSLRRFCFQDRLQPSVLMIHSGLFLNVSHGCKLLNIFIKEAPTVIHQHKAHVNTELHTCLLHTCARFLNKRCDIHYVVAVVWCLIFWFENSL